jgi:hypothetical protein
MEKVDEILKLQQETLIKLAVLEEKLKKVDEMEKEVKEIPQLKTKINLLMSFMAFTLTSVVAYGLKSVFG